MTRGDRVVETTETETEAAAIDLALKQLLPDDLIVLGIESIEQSMALVESRLLERC